MSYNIAYVHVFQLFYLILLVLWGAIFHHYRHIYLDFGDFSAIDSKFNLSAKKFSIRMLDVENFIELYAVCLI